MKETRQSFTDEEIKEIVISVLGMEFMANDLDYVFAVGTFSDFKKAVRSNKKNTRKEQNDFIKSLGSNTIAYHSEGNKGIIFFTDRIRKYKTLEKQLFVTIFSCYHEVRHAIQKGFKDYSYEKFLYDIEDIYREKNVDHYVDNHDLYSFEIGADLYAITKTIHKMKTVYPAVYEKEKAFIEGMKKRTIDNYYLYNAYFFVNDLIIDVVNKRKVPDNKVLKMFFNEDGSFKLASDIIHDENYDKLDKRVVNLMFSCCLLYMDLDNEDLEGLKALRDSNEYMLNLQVNQEKYLSKIRNK
ncbi:MAG: hypothetical protein IKF36_04105 [Bacilli bacterium]|nr:hypothetical protein [Bacilli bacterium]